MASKVVIWSKENRAVPWGLVVLRMFWQEFKWRQYEVEVVRRRSAPQTLRAPPDLWRSLSELGPDDRLDILSLLHTAREFQSKDPRDKIFALLGLGTETYRVDRLAPGQIPDYRKSKVQVLKDFVYSYICEQKSLDILSTALVPSSLLDATSPSWVQSYPG